MTQDDLIFKDDDVEYMKLCLEVAVYWRGSLFDHAAEVEGCYRRALTVIGDRLKFYATHEMSHAQPIDAVALEILPRWLGRPDPTQDIFTLNLDGNSVPDLPSDTAFDFWASQEDGAGVLRLILPLHFIQEGPARLHETARTLAGDLMFHSGCAGYSINWDDKGETSALARRTMGVLSKRFPAIELPDPNVTLMAIPSGLKRVNWLTFVGRELLEQLGGTDALIAPLAGSDIGIDHLPGGLLLTAGDRPRLGDVNRQEDLGAYRAVGHAVAPVRTRDHVGFLADQNFDVDDDLSEEWLAYFDP
ncbi:MAG TPA: type VI immunity family protein [Polyangiaceae bacterium]